MDREDVLSIVAFCGRALQLVVWLVLGMTIIGFFLELIDAIVGNLPPGEEVDSWLWLLMMTIVVSVGRYSPVLSFIWWDSSDWNYWVEKNLK